MRINVALILSIMLAVGLVAFGFTVFQIAAERESLNGELESKTVRLSEEFYNTYLQDLESKDSIRLNITDSLISQYSIEGLAILPVGKALSTYSE